MNRAITMFSIAALLSARVATAQTRAFLVRLGTDTFAIERFTRTGNTVVGEVVRHVPSTTILRYTLALAADGTPATYEEGTFAADGTPLPPTPQGIAQTGLKMRFMGDSVVREIVRNGQVVSKRNAVPHGTLPTIGGTSPYYQELALDVARRLNTNTFSFMTFAMNTDSASTAEVRFIRRDSAEIWLSGFPRVYTLDSQGRILRGDGARSTLRQVITPVKPVDIAPIARAWAARDAQGLAFGMPSTRDTVNARVGDAAVWIDYGRPAKRGRVVWGQLVPFDTVWRFGANAAAQLKTDKDLFIGEAVVPAGLYSVWLLPSAKHDSYLIVNRQSGQWGTVYDASQDLVRIPVARHPVATNREERFRVSFDKAHLSMQWDDVGYDVPVRAIQRAAVGADQLARADAAFQGRAWQQSADLYRAIVGSDATNGMAWFRLGVSLEQLARNDDAVSALSQASQIGFQRGTAELRMARLLAKQGKTPAALEHLRRLVPLAPSAAILDGDSAFVSLRATTEFVAIHKMIEDARYPCRAVHTFDFWVGEFDAKPWNQPDGPTGGTLHNSKEYEGCVIVERWSAAGGQGAGMSMAFYDVNRKVWRMIWNDDANSSNDFEGSYHDGAMRFEGWVLDPNGKRVLARNVLEDVTPDLIRHIYSTSPDSGKTWIVHSDGRFVRRKVSSGTRDW